MALFFFYQMCLILSVQWCVESVDCLFVCVAQIAWDAQVIGCYKAIFALKPPDV